MRTIQLTFTIMVPEAIIAQGAEVIEEYLNDKLYEDPEFYGDITKEDFVVLDKSEPTMIDCIKSAWEEKYA